MKKQIIRSLRVPPKTKWLRADIHPMSKKLSSFFQEKGIRIKVTRIFPGTLIDIFELEAMTKVTSNKKLNLVIDQLSKEMKDENIQYWKSVMDDKKLIKRSAIAIPKTSYKFEAPNIEFSLKDEDFLQSKKCIKDLDDSLYFNIAREIEKKLENFDLPCKIINVIKGPVVDTFELELGDKVEIKKILAVKDDISLSILGIPIRFKNPTMGKSTLGIEVQRIHLASIKTDVIDTSESDLSNTVKTNFTQAEYRKAVNFVLESRIASPSFLQRKLKIGHVKANSMIAIMEREGIVGPLDRFKPRKVLVKPKETISRNQRKKKQ